MDGFKTQLKNGMSKNCASLSLLKNEIFVELTIMHFPIQHDQAN